MPVSVLLPAYLQGFAHGHHAIKLSQPVGTVQDALQALASRYPGVVARVCTEQGEVREHVNIFVDGESIRYTDGLDTPVGNASEILIVPAVSGG